MLFSTGVLTGVLALTTYTSRPSNCTLDDANVIPNYVAAEAPSDLNNV